MNRNGPMSSAKSPLRLKRCIKAGPLDDSQGVDSNSTGQVDTSRGKELHREIAGLARQDRASSVSGGILFWLSRTLRI